MKINALIPIGYVPLLIVAAVAAPSVSLAQGMMGGQCMGFGMGTAGYIVSLVFFLALIFMMTAIGIYFLRRSKSIQGSNH